MSHCSLRSFSKLFGNSSQNFFTIFIKFLPIFLKFSFQMLSGILVLFHKIFSRLPKMSVKVFIAPKFYTNLLKHSIISSKIFKIYLNSYNFLLNIFKFSLKFHQVSRKWLITFSKFSNIFSNFSSEFLQKKFL